jgi:hypothetical protein
LVDSFECVKMHGPTNPNLEYPQGVDYNPRAHTVFKKVYAIVCFLPDNSLASEFRHLGITQKEAYNIQNTAKV